MFLIGVQITINQLLLESTKSTSISNCCSVFEVILGNVVLSDETQSPRKNLRFDELMPSHLREIGIN
jgi:hypothetical protein